MGQKKRLTGQIRIEGGGMGDIFESEGSRVLKGNRARYSEEATEMFKEWMGTRFDFLSNFNDDPNFQQSGSEVVFRIPANTLRLPQVESMILSLERFKLMRMGYFPSDIFVELRKDDIIRTHIENIERASGATAGEQCLNQLMEIFNHLREFLIVEYLNLFNSPLTEHFVHNMNFYIAKEEDHYVTLIELEYWGGTEDMTLIELDHKAGTEDMSLAELDGWGGTVHQTHKAEIYYHSNLSDTLEGIKSKPSLERNASLQNLLEAMGPLARAVDFVVSDSFFPSIDENGDVQLTKKISFNHFDLRTVNIFVRELFNKKNVKTYSLVIGDWGCSFSPLPPGGYPLGYPRSAAPELFYLPSVSQVEIRRADVYAFGVMLFEVLVGEKPIIYQLQSDRKTPDTITAMDASTGKPIQVETNLLSYERDKYDLIERGIATQGNVEEVMRVLAKAMSIDPRHRYPSCEEMMRELNEVMHVMPEQVGV